MLAYAPVSVSVAVLRGLYRVRYENILCVERMVLSVTLLQLPLDHNKTISSGLWKLQTFLQDHGRSAVFIPWDGHYLICPPPLQAILVVEEHDIEQVVPLGL